MLVGSGGPSGPLCFDQRASHNRIGIKLEQSSAAGFNIGIGGIGLDLVEDTRLDTGTIQLLNDRGGNAGADKVSIANNKQTPAAPIAGLFGQLGAATSSMKNCPR